MRLFFRVLLTVLLATPATPPAWAEHSEAIVCVGISPLQGKVRPLLVRALSPPDGPAFDQIRISITEGDSAGARIVRGSPTWKLKKGKHGIRLVAKEATHGPVEVRIDFKRAVVPKGQHVELRLLARGRTVAEFPDQRFHTFPLRDLDGVLALPPLLTAGERLTLRPLDLCLTPLDGHWTLGKERATPLPQAPTLLAVNLATQLDSLTPLPLSFKNAAGETLVEISDLFDGARVRVAPSIEEAAPRLAACDEDLSQTPQTCVCGWFPDPETRRHLLVDGRAAPLPTSVSQRALCFDLEPGPHRFEFPDTASFPPNPPVELRKITLAATRPPPLRPGKRGTYVWTVTGTEHPIELSIRNLTPGIVSLEGGPVQRVRTSGGLPNTVQREFKGLRQGIAKVQATALTQAAGGTEFRSLLRRALLRDLARLRASFLREIDRRQARRRPQELAALVDANEKDLLAVLRFRELAPLREYVRAVFEEELRPQARSLAGRSAALAPPPQQRPQQYPQQRPMPLPWPVVLGTVVFTHLEAGTANGVLDRLLQLFETLTTISTTLVRDLEVASDPSMLMVHLHPKAFPGDVRSTGTTGTLNNLYFGRYHFELRDPKRDRRISSGHVDLIHQTQGTLCLAGKSWQTFISKESRAPCRKP